MTDFGTPEQPHTVTATAGGISMTIDLHQMLTAIDPEGRWLGYDPDMDEERYEPSSLAIQIADMTADRLVKVMRREVMDMVTEKVSDEITGQVAAIVREHIDGTEVQETDEWGQPKGTPPRPLTKMIIDAATKGMSTRDNYGRGKSPLEKMVDEAVTRTFKTELTQVVNEARAAATKAVQDTAATVIRETIERASRGL